MIGMWNWKDRVSWIYVLVTAALAWAFNHVLDLTASGAVKLWSTVLQIATWGSSTMRDVPYASAALNPYQNPSLSLMSCVLGAMLAVAGILSVRLYFALFRARRKLTNLHQPEPDITKDGLMKKIKRTFILSIPLVTSGWIMVLGAVIGVSAINEAVYARRIYEADRDIVAPYITPAELIQLQADFAEVETRDQYKAIIDRLTAVADKHHVKIHRMDW